MILSIAFEMTQQYIFCSHLGIDPLNPAQVRQEEPASAHADPQEEEEEEEEEEPPSGWLIQHSSGNLEVLSLCNEGREFQA